MTNFKKLKRNWENFFFGQTYQISEYYGKYPLYESLWLINDKLPEIVCKSRNPRFLKPLSPVYSCYWGGFAGSRQSTPLRRQFEDSGCW